MNKAIISAGLFLLISLECVFQLSAAVIFPAGPVAVSCSLSPPVAALQATIPLKTDSGTVNLFGLVEPNTFLVNNKPLFATVTPAGVNVFADIDTSVLKFGHNKAYIGFTTGTSNTYAGYVTVDVNCSPTSTITLTNESIDVALPEGGSPTQISGVTQLQGVTTYQNKPITFTMTADTQGSVSPWVTSASIPGSPVNTGSIAPGDSQDLTVNLNPAGLTAQADPYVGYVHIRDNSTGFGSADLTVRLAVNAAVTGNTTLPHFSANGPFVTGFYVVNAGVLNANYRINFYGDTGTLLTLPISGQAPANSVSGVLLPGASAYYEVGDPSQAAVNGSARLVADPGVFAQSLFRLHLQDSLGNRYYEATVPSTVGSKEFVIPFDATKFAPTNDQTFTAFAIANMDSSTNSLVSCTARDSSGNVIPNAVTVPSLPPNGHWADFNFPLLLGKRGSIDCTGTTMIGAIALHSYSVSGSITSLSVLLK